LADLIAHGRADERSDRRVRRLTVRASCQCAHRKHGDGQKSFRREKHVHPRFACVFSSTCRCHAEDDRIDGSFSSVRVLVLSGSLCRILLENLLILSNWPLPASARE
jgi:hypothetical protein